MKGEFDSPSKPATSQYRDGWDRAFGVPEKTSMSSGFSLPFGTYGIYAHPSMPENELRLLTVKDGEPSVFTITNIGKEEITGYPNGCPILGND
jgi:hypothetical protein